MLNKDSGKIYQLAESWDSREKRMIA